MNVAIALATSLHLAAGGVAYEKLDDALAHSKQDGRRVLIYVHASWCPPCKRMAREFFDTSDGASVLRSVHVVPLDRDADAGALELWAITAVPTLIVLRSDGSEVDRIVGYANPRELTLRLTPLFHPELTIAQLNQKREAATDDARRATIDVEVARHKLKAGETDAATSLLEDVAGQGVPAAADALFYLATALRPNRRGASSSVLSIWRELFTRFPDSPHAPFAEASYAEQLHALHARYPDGDQLGFQLLRTVARSAHKSPGLAAERVDNLVEFSIVHDIHREVARAVVESAVADGTLEKEEGSELETRLRRSR